MKAQDYLTAARALRLDEWDESAHPRAENGQFGEGSGSARTPGTGIPGYAVATKGKAGAAREAKVQKLVKALNQRSPTLFNEKIAEALEAGTWDKVDKGLPTEDLRASRSEALANAEAWNRIAREYHEGPDPWHERGRQAAKAAIAWRKWYRVNDEALQKRRA